MSPSEVSRLLELVLEVRDGQGRTEEQIIHIREKLENGTTRMDDHSDKFPKVVKRLEDLEGINFRTSIEKLPERLDALERINSDNKRRWDTLSSPVKFVLFLLLSLATTAAWSMAYDYLSSKIHLAKPVATVAP